MTPPDPKPCSIHKERSAFCPACVFNDDSQNWRTDPQPTAPPTVAPASDAYVEELKKQTQHIEGFIAHTLIARIESDRAEMADDAALIMRQNATIAKQAEEIAGLRARVAELEAALSKLEKGIFDLASGSPICQLHRLKLSGLVDFIRAALKPEPPKEKL